MALSYPSVTKTTHPSDSVAGRLCNYSDDRKILNELKNDSSISCREKAWLTKIPYSTVHYILAHRLHYKWIYTTVYGEDNFDQYEKFDLIGDDYQASLLEALFKDPETFAKKGEELKTAFRNFKGILLNYKNFKLVVKHNGLTDDFVEPVVDWPSKELNFINSFEISKIVHET